jgi:hypothetical protein
MVFEYSGQSGSSGVQAQRSSRVKRQVPRMAFFPATGVLSFAQNTVIESDQIRPNWA